MVFGVEAKQGLSREPLLRSHLTSVPDETDNLTAEGFGPNIKDEESGSVDVLAPHT